MEEIQERLNKFLKHINIPMRQFERDCGIGQGLGSKLSLKSYSTTFKRISDAYPQLNIQWLKTGEGEMLNSPTKFNQSNSGGNNQQIEKVGDHADLRTGTFYEPCPEDDKRIRDLEKEVENLKGKLVHKEDVICQMKKTEKSQEKRINESNERIAELKERVTELKERIADLNSK
ncbi:MAG: hypothetical protein NC095_06555 [Muribaculum sp.]|nr:hypothetical protein [Muribaculum sp.]